LNSFELTGRAGLRFHLTSRDLRVTSRGLLGREKPSKRRVVLRDYLRVEERNFFYSTDKPDSSTWRVRNRFECQYPLNRERTSMDGARYLMADWAWFVPMGDPSERFANSQRDGWFAGLGDFNVTFNWEDGGAATIPLGPQVGKVFTIGSQPISVSAEAAYVVARLGAHGWRGPVPQKRTATE